MKNSLYASRAPFLAALATFMLSMLMAAGATAATPHIDDKELTELGFKVLVATTEVQKNWVKGMAPGKIRAMQRNGKKFFIYPDAAREQIFVGGPREYAAYQERHPPSAKEVQKAAQGTAAYRQKQDQMMKSANARDLSDPFLGVSWYDLGW
jgi:hypothetical protein